MLVPFREGSASLAKPVQGAGAKSRSLARHVVDNDHLLIWNRETLTVFRLPRDASGKAPWIDSPVSLESLISSVHPAQSGGASDRHTDNKVGPQSPAGMRPAADAAPEMQSVAAVRDIYTNLIVGDGKQLGQRMRGIRPATGRDRLALGVWCGGHRPKCRRTGPLAQRTRSGHRLDRAKFIRFVAATVLRWKIRRLAKDHGCATDRRYVSGRRKSS